jgi:hypothetical protein
MLVDWKSVRVLRILIVTAVVPISATTVCAQDSSAPVSNASCIGVAPPAPSSQNTYPNVPVYFVQPGAPRQQSVCEAAEALAGGMIAIAMNDDRVLAVALGEPGPEANVGKVSEFPYLAPGSQAIPGMPPPGPSPEISDGFHAYAAFVDPTSGVEYDLSSVGQTAADTEADIANWISSTVQPLLGAAASGATAASAGQASSSPLHAMAIAAAVVPKVEPSYSRSAWTKVKNYTLAASGNQIQMGDTEGFNRVLGANGAEIAVYRLNASAENDDYFLVDTRYTQTPRWDTFTYGFASGLIGNYWANAETDYELQASDPEGIAPRLIDFAPRTPITQTTETFTVGASLGSDLAVGVEASYSVSVTQDSVETAVTGTIGMNKVNWIDTYNGFNKILAATYPSTLINTFTGERLAIFKVPRTINNSRPNASTYNPGAYPGLLFFPFLRSVVQGYVYNPFILGTSAGPTKYAEWATHIMLFAPEPQFSASPLTNVTVSKSQNSATNPVIINVVAQLADGGAKLAWLPQLQGTSLETDAPQQHTGSGTFAIYPTPNAVVGSSTTVVLNTVPAAAADSVRGGPIKIPVTIVQ